MASSLSGGADVPEFVISKQNILMSKAICGVRWTSLCCQRLRD